MKKFALVQRGESVKVIRYKLPGWMPGLAYPKKWAEHLEYAKAVFGEQGLPSMPIRKVFKMKIEVAIDKTRPKSHQHTALEAVLKTLSHLKIIPGYKNRYVDRTEIITHWLNAANTENRELVITLWVNECDGRNRHTTFDLMPVIQEFHSNTFILSVGSSNGLFGPAL